MSITNVALFACGNFHCLL